MTDSILGAEIPPDRLDACAGVPAADDAGERGAGPGADIGAGIQGKGSAPAVLELADFPEMQDAAGYAEVAYVKRGGSGTAVCGGHGDAHPVLVVPDIRCGAAPHPAATAV